MALAETYKDRDACLEIAQRAAFTTSTGLEDKLDLTAVGEYFRPFAAAYSWLEAHPKWAEEFTGRKGLKRRNLAEALSGLAKDQSLADATLGLDVPDYLQIKLPKLSVPGPSFQPWR